MAKVKSQISNWNNKDGVDPLRVVTISHRKYFSTATIEFVEPTKKGQEYTLGEIRASTVSVSNGRIQIQI
jgi:hypothetical protein